MNPLTYSPQSPAEFIGQARSVASFFEKLLADSIANQHTPIKVLLNGPPGVGKSELAKYLQTIAKVHPRWSTTKTNGTKFNMEAIADMEASMIYRDIYGAYQMYWIDEVDKVLPQQQVRFLSTLDDLGPGNIVICTSNCNTKDFEPRFQSRFIVQELTPVPAAEIEWLLLKFIGSQPQGPNIAKQIATFACGNVRQALLDLKGALLQLG